MPDIALRRYHPDDATAVWDLHVAAFQDARGYDQAFADRDADLHRVVEEYLGTDGSFLVGELQGGARAGEVVAMGGFQPAENDEDTAVLRRMRVHPDFQREGFGSRVLDELEQRADAAGFERLTLDTAASMAAARQFYEAHGYEEVDREPVTEAGRTIVFYAKEL